MTLHYYLSEPNHDVQDGHRSIEQTEMAQVLCLSMMALQSTSRDQLWRKNVQKICSPS